jgi:hypothetical protein
VIIQEDFRLAAVFLALGAPPPSALQGYLAHKKDPPRRTLQ